MPVETRLYDVLGVSPTANAGEIKRAYHKKSLACHPDKNPPERQEEASREFQEVGHAFEILSDDDARAQYDAVGEQDMRAGGAGGGPGADDLDDIFGAWRWRLQKSVCPFVAVRSHAEWLICVLCSVHVWRWNGRNGWRTGATPAAASDTATSTTDHRRVRRQP